MSPEGFGRWVAPRSSLLRMVLVIAVTGVSLTTELHDVRLAAQASLPDPKRAGLERSHRVLHFPVRRSNVHSERVNRSTSAPEREFARVLGVVRSRDRKG